MVTPLLASTFVVLARVFFQIRKLNIKRLQECGATPLTTLYLQSFALLPAAALLTVTFKTEYLTVILEPAVLAALGTITVLWVLQEMVGFYLIDYFASLAFLSAVSSLISIPATLTFSYYLNHDQPNIYAFLALGTLALAILLHPTMHIKSSTAKRLPKKLLHSGLALVVFLAIFGTVADEFNSALYRFVLQNLNATLFGVGLYTTLIMLATTIFFWVRPVATTQKKLAQKHGWLAFSIAPLWFLASLPEGYGYASVPVFTYSAISAVAFLSDVISDLKNGRLHPNARTLVFCTLVAASTLLATWSLRG